MKNLLWLILCVVLPFSSLAVGKTLDAEFDDALKAADPLGMADPAEREKAKVQMLQGLNKPLQALGPMLIADHNHQEKAKVILLKSLTDLVQSLRETSLTSRWKVWNYTAFKELESLHQVQYLSIAKLGLKDSAEKNNLLAVRLLRDLSSNQPIWDRGSKFSFVDTAVTMLITYLNKPNTALAVRAAIIEALGQIPANQGIVRYEHIYDGLYWNIKQQHMSIDQEIAHYAVRGGGASLSDAKHLQLTAVRALGNFDLLSVSAQKTLSAEARLNSDEAVMEAAVKALERTAEAGRLNSEVIMDFKEHVKIEPYPPLRTAMESLLSKVPAAKAPAGQAQKHNPPSQPGSSCEGSFS